MKTILMFCFAFVVTASASAQKYGRHYYSQPRVRSSIILGFGYNPYYSPYYSPYGVYGAPIYSRPSRLDIEIADIRSDYNDRIWSAKHDNSLSKSERKSEVRRLKSERDRAIRDSEYNY